MAKHTQTIRRQFANQWSGFYMITTSVMKELEKIQTVSKNIWAFPLTNFNPMFHFRTPCKRQKMLFSYL